ncbi:hypothetical protein HanPI659440_Chr02g0048191 [Helianthus annuus]|nr:hypothetical protein HanPI659440_Chr02g0048191 [Helianthus annuus]
MSGLGRICKDCTSLRTWSMIGVCGDVGLRLRISSGGYNCVLGVVYRRRYVSMCIDCLCCYIRLVYHVLFHHSCYIGSFIYTHTHISCSIYFFLGCFGAEGLTGNNLFIHRGRGKADCVEAKEDRQTALHLVKKRKQLHTAGLSVSENRYVVGEKSKP